MEAFSYDNSIEDKESAKVNVAEDKLDSDE